MLFLGIDTSCYTTSVAAVDQSGRVVADRRRLLEVKAGQRGLRQSEAVFQHLKNLPCLMEEIKEFLPQVGAVAVSNAPRREKDSYMPVFVAGKSFARTLAAARGVPLYLSTHQEGHIMAAAVTGAAPEAKELLAVHLSGGTTEIVAAKADGAGYETQIIGKTLDIPAGQLVDRVGVKAGLGFPCGKQMDLQARDRGICLPVTVKGCDLHFSGAETAAMRLLEQGADPAGVFYAVFECVGKTLGKALDHAVKRTGYATVVMAGGVSANAVLRRQLAGTVRFCPPEYAADNAVGTAYLCKRVCERGESKNLYHHTD